MSSSFACAALPSFLSTPKLVVPIFYIAQKNFLMDDIVSMHSNNNDNCCRSEYCLDYYYDDDKELYLQLLHSYLVEVLANGLCFRVS